jgi:hypothetical protein
MHSKYWLLLLVFAVLLNTGSAMAVDGFYVIGGGGQAGKILKTQVFTSSSQNLTLGTSSWEKLSSPGWTYHKLSATSYLVITYQDMLSRTGAGDSLSLYQLRVNDQPSVAGQYAAMLTCNGSVTGSYGATGVWEGFPKGDVSLSVWHRQLGCDNCVQNSGVNTTNVMVMEIETK